MITLFVRNLITINGHDQNEKARLSVICPSKKGAVAPGKKENITEGFSNKKTCVFPDKWPEGATCTPGG